MKRIAARDLLKKDQSYYSLVVGVARRARQISEEAEENGEILTEKPVQLAVQELAKGDFRIITKMPDDKNEE